MKKTLLKLSAFVLIINLLMYVPAMAYSNDVVNEEQSQNKITYFDMETRKMVTEEIPTLNQILKERNRSNVTINIDENGGRIEPYIADPTTEIDPNIITEPNDGRQFVANTRVYPYKTVCYLEVTFPNGRTDTYGTGVLVYKDIVLTAGHVVYRPDCGGYATKVAVFPGRAGDTTVSGSEPYQYTTVQNLYVDPAYVNGDGHSDWAMMKTYNTIGDWVGAWMGIAYSEDYSFFVDDNLSVSVVGYPMDKGDPAGNHKQFFQWYSRDKVFAVNNKIMVYLTDTYSGQSGAPVYEKDQYVVAIHHGEFVNSYQKMNYGVNINKERFEKIVGWMQ